MRQIIMSLAAAFLLSGCTSAMSILDEAAQTGGEVADDTLNAAAWSIDQWCLNAPNAARFALRSAINTRTKVGDISIACDGDL